MVKLNYIKCDRCGQIFDADSKDVSIKMVKIPDFTNPNYNPLDMDFCYACAESFENMIRASVQKWLDKKPVVTNADVVDNSATTEKSPKEDETAIYLDPTASINSCYINKKRAKAFQTCAYCDSWEKCNGSKDPEFKEAVNKASSENKKEESKDILKEFDEESPKKDKLDPDKIKRIKAKAEELSKLMHPRSGKVKSHTKDHLGSKYPWTVDELSILHENYKTKDIGWIADRLGRSEASVRSKMIALKMYDPEKAKDGDPYGYWEDSEMEILYNNKDKSDEEVAKLLPKRTAKAVNLKRNSLGISVTKKFKRWEKWEVDYLIDNAKHMTITQMAMVIQNHSRAAIQTKVNDLNLDYIKSKCGRKKTDK